MADWTPEELFERFRRQGDSRSFQDLFDRSAPELLRIARRLTRNRADAEDVVQATWLVAIERAETFDRARRLQPWLVGILVRQAGLARRRDANARTGQPIEAAQVADPGRALEERELGELVARALAELPTAERDALIPLLTDSKRAGEIARELGRSRNSVYVSVHRGLTRLRRLLAPAVGLGLLLDRRALARIREHVQLRALSSAPTAATAAYLGAGGLLTLSKAVLASLAVAALAATWFVVRPAPQGGGGEAGVAPTIALVSESGRPDALASPSERTRISEVPASPTAAAKADAARRWIVRGQIRGPGSQRMLQTKLTVVAARDSMSWNPKHSCPIELQASGRFEIDVSDFFTERHHTLPATLDVTFDHPDFLPSKQSVAVEDGREASAANGGPETVFECAADLQLASILTGRVFAPPEADSEECTVLACLLEGGSPKVVSPKMAWSVSDEATVFVSHDSEQVPSGQPFRLRLAGPGTFAVLAVSDSSAPTTRLASCVIGEELALGTIRLDSGASVCGRVALPPAIRDRLDVQAHLSAPEPTMDMPYAAGCRWSHGEFHRIVGRTTTDETGAFCVRGFEPGVAVDVATENCSVNVTMQYRSLEETWEHVVTPATGVELSAGCSRIRIELRGLPAGVQRVPFRLIELAEEADLRELELENTRILGWSSGTAEVERELVITGAPGRKMPIELEPPEFRRWARELVFPEAGQETVVVAEFESLASARIRFLFRDRDGRPVAQARVDCQELDPATGTKRDATLKLPQESVLSAGGEFTFEKVYPGRYRVDVYPGALSAVPDGFYMPEHFDLEVAPGATVDKELAVTLCGRLDVTVRTSGAASQSIPFALIGPRGAEHDVRTVQFVEAGWTEQKDSLHPGVSSLRDPLPPGEYVLELQRAAGKPVSAKVTIEAGKLARMTIDLDER